MERRVLFVYRDLSPGGLAVDIANLAGALVDRGWDVDVATITSSTGTAAGAEHALDPRVGLHGLRPMVPGSATRRLGLATGIGRVVRHTRPAVVHVMSCLPVYVHFAAMRAARRTGRALVWTPMTHSRRAEMWHAYRASIRWPMLAFDAAVPSVCRWADVICAATIDEAEYFERQLARRVELVPPAVVPMAPASEVERRAVRSMLGIGGRPFVLVVAGRDEPRKGLDFAWGAAARLRASIPSTATVVVGDVTSSRSAAPDEDVICTGRLPNADLARAYAAADVVFVPSRFEAFSRVVIEAWERARPVVVSAGVGLASTVAEGGGLVVPYGDPEAASEALRSLLVDTERAAAMGAWGRRRVESTYLLPPVVDRLESVYGELLAHRMPSRPFAPVRNELT